MHIFQGAGQKGAIARIKASYWMILKLNWTVWTLIQYININHIPLKVNVVVCKSNIQCSPLKVNSLNLNNRL